MENLRVCGNCKHWIGSECDIYIADNVSEKEKACDDFEMKDHFADASKMVEDAVNHPAHYTQGGIECIDCIKAALSENFIGFLIGNVIKYTYRYKEKNGVEDLRKAQWYLERAIKEMSENDE